MNSLILCEGYTDAILLSYYLSHTCGWVHTLKPPAHLQIKTNSRNNESAEWYKRGGDYLLICAVGSKDRFARFFDERIAAPLVTSEAFAKIALLLDRDDETEEEIVRLVRAGLPLVASSARHNEWVTHTYRNSYKEDRQLDFLLLIVPAGRQGALETLLLEAISEDEYDRNIVEKSRLYVDSIAPEAARYIGKRRLVLKACLGVTWAIQSPQKVFRFIDEQLRAVPWENSQTLRETFRRLTEI